MKQIVILMVLAATLLAGGEHVLYSIDFSKMTGDPFKVLKQKGFELLLDSEKFHMYFDTEKGLVIETDKKQTALFGVRFKKPLEGAVSATIEWGVERFPEGADWSRGKNRLAIGALIALGTEKFSSGVPFVQKAPYFLGPFIGEKEQPGKRYLGKLYKQSGRYYCVSNKRGVTVTRFDIAGSFQKAFGKPLPPLVAFGLQMNTKDTSGAAKAFVKKITILGQ